MKEYTKNYKVTLNYDKIKNILNAYYQKKKIGNITYFLNEFKCVVATESKDVLNLYFNYYNPQNIITNTPVSMTIIKNFKLKRGIFNRKRADIIITSELNDKINKLTHSNKKVIIKRHDPNLVIDPGEKIKWMEKSFGYSDKDRKLEIAKLQLLKKKLETAEDKFKIGSIYTIDHNVINDNLSIDKFTIPGYNIEFNDDIDYNFYRPNYGVLNENINTNDETYESEKTIKHRNYIKLVKPKISRDNIFRDFL